MDEDQISWIGWWSIGLAAIMIGIGALVGLNWELIGPRVAQVLGG